MTGFHKFHATGTMLSIIFLQPFHGVMAHKSLDKATPHWQNHKTNGDSDASKWAAKKNHLLPAAHCFGGGNVSKSSAKENQSLSTTLCFDNEDISDLSTKEKHLLPAAPCFGGGNTSKWASKGIKNMQPKQSIDDDETLQHCSLFLFRRLFLYLVLVIVLRER